MKKYKNQQEIDALARDFITLRNKAQKSKSKILKKKFQEYQNFCIDRFHCLVTAKVGRYRKFSNYQDLEQDGMEALVLALRTYKPKKGSFTWWANKYIATRVSRAANAHSTIRFPLKKAKDIKPFKTSTMPVIIDSQLPAVDALEQNQESIGIANAIAELPEQHKKLIDLIYGFNGMKPHSIGNAQKTLSISRTQCLRLLEEAKDKLKEKLTEID